MKKNNIQIFLIISLMLIILMKIDFFKKTFFIINKPYNERFIDAYNKNQFSGFCTKESHGYVYFIKNKYQLIYPPKIINLAQSRPSRRVKLPYWIFGKNKREIQNNKIILLNYNSNKNFNLDNFLIKNNYNNQCFFLVNK